MYNIAPISFKVIDYNQVLENFTIGSQKFRPEISNRKIKKDRLLENPANGLMWKTIFSLL